MTLYFDLNAFAETNAGHLTDGDLLRRVDRRVAMYYLAVPLAGEDNRVTVATAYPENADALRVLERLLQAAVVPVTGSDDELRATIARLYPEIAPGEGAVMAWANDPAWCDSVIATANAFGRAADRPVIIMDATATPDEVLERASYDFSLIVARASDQVSLERLVRRSPVSLLLVRGDYAPADHVLVALRGFGSDFKTLNQVYPILARKGTGATVLPLSHPGSVRPGDPLSGYSPARRHLRQFLLEMDRKNVHVDVRMSQGDPAGQIVSELAQGPYDMLVVAAEAEGDFVWQVLSRIECEGVWPNRPVLVVKPPVWPDSNQE
ncbi:MAG: hypothetical protein KA170_01795 [Candidatus Promineofilum sp.]|nr:hypothetical protein [Promineifilum sp.]